MRKSTSTSCRRSLAAGKKINIFVRIAFRLRNSSQAGSGIIFMYVCGRVFTCWWARIGVRCRRLALLIVREPANLIKQAFIGSSSCGKTNSQSSDWELLELREDQVTYGLARRKSALYYAHESFSEGKQKREPPIGERVAGRNKKTRREHYFPRFL